MNPDDSTDRPPVNPGAPPGSARSASSGDPPGTIGPYRILRVLGEGGMGVVYEAEQRVALKRRVALKVMKPGLDSKEVLARFEAERQALAVMQHPGIAKVLDAGATEEGRPYFVMELVDGESLKDYADGKKLSIEDRVRLFVEVCHAVQHAHLKGVIHRDLKPSNVLVTERDDVPSPRVIDFGIAKAMGQRLTETTLVTGFGQALGTPAYMSPEQADVSGLDVDTRTDVYSLGVTLYELLVGRLPQDPDELGFAGFMTKLLMRDMDPPTPSTRYNTLEGDTQQAIAKFRRTDPKGLSHKVRGDLDWIAMKAIEKDRERRYATANDLALDLERCLRDEPVLARPPSARYRAAKFIRRRRAGVAMTAAAVVLVLMTVAVLVQAAQSVREAERQRERAQAAEALLGTQSVGTPLLAQRVVVEALDAVRTTRNDTSRGRPELEASFNTSLGLAYMELGQHEKARPLLDSALGIRRRLYDGPHPDVAASLDHLADLERAEGHYAAADSLYRAGLTMRRSTLGDRHPDVAVSLVGLGVLHKDARDFEVAEPALRDALAIREQAAADSSELAEVWDALGTLYWAQERYEEAEPLLRQALAARRSFSSSESRELASSMNNLAALLDDVGENDEAESLYREARALLQARAPESEQLATITGNLAVLLDLRKEEYDAAENMYREALTIKKAVLGDDHPEVALARHNLAGLLCEVRGELAEGVTLLDDAIPVFEREQDFRSAIARSMRGVCLRGLGRYAEAEADLLAALPALETEYGIEHFRTQQARERLVTLYDVWNRPDRAALYRENPAQPE